MTSERRPLIVRLRNWVGDVTLGLPMLQRIADAGFDLHLVGKPWARDLLAGHGWPVHALPGTWRERVQLLRRLKAETRAGRAGVNGRAQRIDALCLPYSLSSALEFRLAGLRALGHAGEGRSPLLAMSVPRRRDVHELQVYWDLGDALLGQVTVPPPRIGLRTAAAHREQARALLRAHGIPPGYLVICPFAGGTWSHQEKTWPDFPGFAAQDLPAFGRAVLVCPGPGEEGIARERFGSATLLAGVGLGAYAALLEDAALMVSNDTGPGHIAAAVGTPLVSVLGPSDPALWRAWGSDVQIVRGDGTWPARDAVRLAVQRRLGGH